MYVLAIFLLFATCDQSTSLGIFNKENNRLQTDFRNGEFFQNVKDWFWNLKDKVHEQFFGKTVPSMPSDFPLEILDLTESELQKRLQNRQWNLIDLSTLAFNPNHDWGFRVGNWYFIRKGYESNSDESDLRRLSTVQPKESAKGTFDVTNNPTSSVGPTTTISAIQTVTSLMTQQTNSETIQTTEPIDSFEYSSSRTDAPGLEVNESDNDFVPLKGSVEVLMG